MKHYIIITLTLLVVQFSFGQNLNELDSYTVEEFYKKVELERGSLDEQGNRIDFVFVKTKVELKAGKYEIEITDGPGDLYEIKDTNLFLKFTSYYGYAGYGDDCILEITNSYYNSATLYKLE